MTKIEWDQTSSKREQLLFLALLLSLVFFFFRTAYSYKIGDLTRYQSNLDALRLEKTALEKFLTSTPIVNLSLARGEPQNVKLQVLAGTIEAPYEDLASVLPRISAPAFLQGIRLIGFSFQPPSAQTGFVQTDFLLEISGAFADVVRYMGRLEEFPALFQMTNLVFSREEEGSANVRAEISCRFYRRSGTTAGAS